MTDDNIGNTLEINLARDFHKHPFGRYVNQGPWSGEKFREEFLVPALKANKVVIVDLSYARALGSSFLEEVFG